MKQLSGSLFAPVFAAISSDMANAVAELGEILKGLPEQQLEDLLRRSQQDVGKAVNLFYDTAKRPGSVLESAPKRQAVETAPLAERH